MVANDDMVFTPLTTPYLTYNKRESEKLESNVKHNLEVGGKIIVLSGPSKIGKTVLIKKVIDKDKRIILEGGDLKSVEDLIILMIRKLSKIPDEIKKIESINSNVGIEGSASLGAKFWNWAYLRITAKASSSINDQKEMIFGDDPFERVTHYMLDRGYTLVIDDFHYIDGTVQREIIRKLKSPLSEGMKVVFALIPSRTEVVIQKEPDMSFRTKVLNVPLWSDDELRYISDRGFEALNTSVEDKVIDKFVENSFANPSLMQAFCSTTEVRYNLKKGNRDRLIIPFDEEELNEIFSENAEFTGDIQQLEYGKSKRGNDRKQFNLRLSDGSIKIVDLYQIVMRALSGLSNSNKITVDQIEAYIDNMRIEQENKDKGKIRKSDIIRILNILSSIAMEMNKSDPIIEYKDPEKTVYMYDSFFSFNLKFHYKNE